MSSKHISCVTSCTDEVFLMLFSLPGYYLYVDSSVGQWGDMSLLISEVFQPSTRGHCLQFWYHMVGNHVGTLRVSINDRYVSFSSVTVSSLKYFQHKKTFTINY